MLTTTLRFRGHPQETTENSVDGEHLSYTHGYSNVELAPVTVDGAHLTTAFDFRIVRRIAALFKVVADVSTVVHIHGLGYSFVEIAEEPAGVRSRMWVLATPVDGTYIELTLATQAYEIRNPKRFFLSLGFLPVGLRHRVRSRFYLREERHYVMQDVVIWERKRYQSPPRLCRTDGPIGKYRLYCRQFYPELR